MTMKNFKAHALNFRSPFVFVMCPINVIQTLPDPYLKQF